MARQVWQRWLISGLAVLTLGTSTYLFTFDPPGSPPTAVHGTAQVAPAPYDPLPGGHPLALEDKETAEPVRTATVNVEPVDAAPEKPRMTQYRVRPGDTLEGIADEFDLDVPTLASANGIEDPSRLQPDQLLLIPSEKGIYHRVRSGDTLWDVARLHQVPSETVEKANSGYDATALPLGGVLFVPGGKPMPTATVAAARRGGGVILQWPLRGRITSPFGNRRDPFTGRQAFHAGIDVAADSGTPIRAAAAGRVTFVGWEGGYGLTVRIDHGDGLVTRYSHNSRNAVAVGQWVEAGQVVAYVGSTGRSTGPHVDFGVYRNGEAQDPLRYLP